MTTNSDVSSLTSTFHQICGLARALFREGHRSTLSGSFFTLAISAHRHFTIVSPHLELETARDKSTKHCVAQLLAHLLCFAESFGKSKTSMNERTRFSDKSRRFGR